MANILPDSLIDVALVTPVSPKVDVKGPRFNFATGKFEFETVDGFAMTSGVDLLRQWCYKALYTRRFDYLAYSHNYGSEIENVLIGSTLFMETIVAEVERYITECVTAHPLIYSAQNFSFSEDSDVLFFRCTVLSYYGEFEIGGPLPNE